MQLQKQILKQKNLCVLWNNLVPAGWLSGTDWDRERLHLQAGFWSWFHVWWGLPDGRSARNPWIWRSLNVDPRWSYTAEQVLHGTPSGGETKSYFTKTTKASGGPVLLGATTNFEFHLSRNRQQCGHPWRGGGIQSRSHAAPSGASANVCLLVWRKREVLPNIFHSDFDYQDLAGLQVLLTNTGVARNTKALVQRWDKYDHSLIFSLFPYPLI